MREYVAARRREWVSRGRCSCRGSTRRGGRPRSTRARRRSCSPVGRLWCGCSTWARASPAPSSAWRSCAAPERRRGHAQNVSKIGDCWDGLSRKRFEPELDPLRYSRSCSMSGRFPIEECSRWWLNQPAYVTVTSSSCRLVRHLEREPTPVRLDQAPIRSSSPSSAIAWDINDSRQYLIK